MPKIDHGKNASRLYSAADALAVLVNKFEEMEGHGGEIYILERVIETIHDGACSIDELTAPIKGEKA
ncbi:hypothetical protein [Maridesulfovibrio sp.]|uniref:hypothetical protein n=1 Tax=Maridesulfovibrio sp. TaxID=2795000 RepID=UPI003BAB0FD4